MIDSPANSSANPLAAAYYADQAAQWTVEVVENERIARDTYRIRLACPELARRITPGQFVMVRLPEANDPLLGRPLALYDTYVDSSGQALGIDVVYLVIGKMTTKLAQVAAGEAIALWGPLGNGFSCQPTQHLVMVAGGIGQTPFLALGRERLGGRKYGNPSRSAPVCERVTLCYGVRNVELAAGVDDFRAAGVEVRLISDDGSTGRPGLVTELLDELLNECGMRGIRIACCGPEPMMEAVAAIAKQRATPCEVSLETPMACGIGICFSCVVRVHKADGSWDYKRTCVDGPIFEAGQIAW